MAIVTKLVSMAALMALTIFVPARAYAQDERFRASFTPAVATVSGDAELALAGSVGYRFSERFWFEGELTWIDAAAGRLGDRTFGIDGDEPARTGLASILGGRSLFGNGRLSDRFRLPAFPNFPDSIPQYVATTEGRTLIGTLGIRYELPVQTERFRPYLAGGLGIGHTEQEIDIERLALYIDDSISDTGFAFSAGAGASVRLVRSLWADMDAKYFRLSRERNIMRLGGGVSFRF